MSNPEQGDVTSVQLHIKWFDNPVITVINGVIHSVTKSEREGYMPGITMPGLSQSGFCYKWTGGYDGNGKVDFDKKDSIVEIQVVTEGCVIESVLFYERTPGTVLYTTIAERFQLQSKSTDSRTIRYLDTDPGPDHGHFAVVISAPFALRGKGEEGMQTGISCDPMWEDEN